VEESLSYQENDEDFEHEIVHYMRIIFLILGYLVLLFFLICFVLWILCLCILIGKAFGTGMSGSTGSYNSVQR
jgi:hypothetical protein